MLDLNLALEIKGLQREEIKKRAEMFDRLSKRLYDVAYQAWFQLNRLFEYATEAKTLLDIPSWNDTDNVETKANEARKKADLYRIAYIERGVFDRAILLAEYNRDIKEGSKLGLPKLEIKSIDNPDAPYDSPQASI